MREISTWLSMLGASCIVLACGSYEQSAGGLNDDESVGEAQQAVVIPSHPDCLSTTLVNPTTLYVAPNGSDTNPGTQALPLASLAGAQAKIPVNYTKDYLIYVRGGVYRQQQTNWTRVSATRRIRIEAFPGETPVFDGRAAGADLTVLPLFFLLSPSSAPTPTPTNVVIKGLTVKYYTQNGFLLGTEHDEVTRDSGVAQTCTTLVDNTITETGSLHSDCVTPSSGPNADRLTLNRNACVVGPLDDWSCKCIGYGSIDTFHVGKSYFKNNKVINAENRSENIGLIHAFYLAYSSQGNVLEGNYVNQVSGVPIKFRHLSSDNRVIGNYIERAGRGYFFGDGPNPGEGLSLRNELKDNLLTFSYNGARNTLTNNRESSFIIDPDQTTGRYLQGVTPAEEIPTAAVAADINGDGKDEYFLALHYPDIGFTKVVYSEGGSPYLSENLYSSTYWKVAALAAGTFGGLGTHLVGAFENGTADHTQIQRTVVDSDGSLRFGSLLHESTGSSAWKVSAMTGAKIAGASFSKLFTAFSKDGVQEIHRGDGFTVSSGASGAGVSETAALYSSSSWEIPAMTAGPVDGGSVDKLVTAFHFIGSGSPKNRIYLGSGSGAGAGITDGGAFFQRADDDYLITSLTTGRLDGSTTRVVTGFDVGGVGQVYLSTGTAPINALGTQLYSSSAWRISALARGEFDSASAGHELITAFDKSSGTQVHAGDGTTAGSGATNLGPYYKSPW